MKNLKKILLILACCGLAVASICNYTDKSIYTNYGIAICGHHSTTEANG